VNRGELQQFPLVGGRTGQETSRNSYTHGYPHQNEGDPLSALFFSMFPGWRKVRKTIQLNESRNANSEL
jgi:hypothetical protein